MRSTPELIAELEQESSKHWYVAMVLVFENSTVFINATAADRLQSLNDAINVGGQPIGLIAVDKTDGKLEIRNKIYPENEDMEELCSDLLTKLTETVATSLTAKLQDNG